MTRTMAPASAWTDSGVTRRAVLAGAALAAGRAVPWPAPAAAQEPEFPAAPVPLSEAAASLEPARVWEHFLELTRIPRPSHHEERVSAFLAEFGRSLGLDTEVDEVGNVLVRKPASAGMEDRQTVLLQAHMDMVPAKLPTLDHDFETDPISAVVDNGWVHAEGTTLGADDGIGVAIIMAILEDDGLAHGPIEALFTVNEEDGFTGANAVEPGTLLATMMINVDSEEEGTFTIGSAGGVYMDAMATYSETAPDAGMAAWTIAVDGLQGGHSGMDIDKGRGNAIKLLARLLAEAPDDLGLRLASFAGGERYNAIPRDATATLVLPADRAADLAALVEAFAATAKSELLATEPNLSVTLAEADMPATVMGPDAQRAFVDALHAVPNGVFRMSDGVPGLVETSSSMGIAGAADGEWSAGFYVRSAVDTARDDAASSIASVFDLAGAAVSTHGGYGGWRPNPDSELLALMQSVYTGLSGHPADVMAVHAGLETSAIGEKYPGMDMISVGPTLVAVHSPDERLEIDTVPKTYELLVETLARIPAGS